MAWCFEDDRSKFNVDAALLRTQKAAVEESRLIDAEKEFINLDEFKTWAKALPVGKHTITCANATSQALGLPWTTFSLIRVYKATTRSITIYAQNISRFAVQFGLECCLTYNGSWGDWMRLFDDILPGDVVSMGGTNVSWEGKGLSNKSFRVTIPMGRRIRANSVAMSGDVKAACMGTLAIFTLNDRPTTPGVEDLYYNIAYPIVFKEMNSVVVRVDFDMGGDLVRAEYPITIQNQASNQLKFAFS